MLQVLLMKAICLLGVLWVHSKGQALNEQRKTDLRQHQTESQWLEAALGVEAYPAMHLLPLVLDQYPHSTNLFLRKVLARYFTGVHLLLRGIRPLPSPPTRRC